jgi:hypothetical protein
MALRSLAFFILLASHAALASAEIAIMPPAPTELDAIATTQAGTWPYTCVPVPESWQLAGAVLRIDLVTSGACFAALTDYEATTEIGTLAAGAYTVEVYVDDYRTAPPEPELLETATFVVLPAAEIPTASPLGLLLLALVLAASAAVALHRAGA